MKRGTLFVEIVAGLNKNSVVENPACCINVHIVRRLLMNVALLIKDAVSVCYSENSG